MIKICKEPGDLTPIFHLKDKFDETFLICSRSEYLQFLVENVGNERVLIVIDLDENEKTAKGYVVSVNGVLPPLSNSVSIIYVFSGDGCDLELIFKYIEDWGRKIGAKVLAGQTRLPDNKIFEKYGWKMTGKVIERKIN